MSNAILQRQQAEVLLLLRHLWVSGCCSLQSVWFADVRTSRTAETMQAAVFAFQSSVFAAIEWRSSGDLEI